jgi:hypothetical protein
MSSVFLFDFFCCRSALVMHGQTIRLIRKIAPIHWVFVLSFMCYAVSAPTKSCECGLNATWVYVANVFFFCRLYPFSPQLHNGSVWFLLVMSLPLTNTVSPGAGLPNHMIGEV